jgi:hypothetical protein
MIAKPIPASAVKSGDWASKAAELTSGQFTESEKTNRAEASDYRARPANHMIDGGREAGLKDLRLLGVCLAAHAAGRERGDALDRSVGQAR